MLEIIGIDNSVSSFPEMTIDLQVFMQFAGISFLHLNCVVPMDRPNGRRHTIFRN